MILLPGEHTEWWAPKKLDCFMCTAPIEGPVVFWCGNGELVLHASCAAYLGQHLLKDAREAQLASGEKPWTARATRAAVAAIERRDVR
jgi:hypothetical protein